MIKFKMSHQNELINLFNNKKYKDLIKKTHHLIKAKKINVILLGNLGLTYLFLNKNHLAIKYFLKIHQLDKGNPNANHNLGLAFNNIGKFNKAIYHYQLALEKGDFFFVTLTELFEVLYSQHETDLARDLIKKYSKFIPLDLKFFLETSLFNLKFKDEISFNQELKNTKNIIDYYLNEIKKAKEKFLLDKLNNKTNYYPPTIFNLTFYLSNPEQILKKYFKIFDYITDNLNIKKTFNPITKNTKKIQIGFASSIFRKHTITREFKNWIFQLDKNKFDIHIIDLKSHKDDVYKEIIKHAKSLITTDNTLEENISLIRNKNLDYIIYLDNHISREATLLYNYRLAKKQAVTWGHPVTSGSKNIDLFLSSELMENKISEKKYTEQLIKLKNISIFYEKPNIKKNITINKLFDNDYINILNVQSLFKFQPYEDGIFAEIINNNDKVKLYFLDSGIKDHCKIFKNRISKFINKKKDLERIIFLPRCDNNTFYNYLYFSTFLIDCSSWSGGNTHLEALSFDKVVVTTEGNSLKQNHTTGFLKRINQNSLITKNKNQYIKKILELSKNINLIKNLEQNISKEKSKLFNDYECIKSLENNLIKHLT